MERLRRDAEAARAEPTAPETTKARTSTAISTPETSTPITSTPGNLLVGATNDPFERQADRVAGEVVSRIRSSPTPAIGEPAAAVQRAATAGPKRIIAREPVVGAEGGALDQQTTREINAARSGGRPLDNATRTTMEGAFGADFSGVRVHDDQRAGELSQRIQAKAFTIGSDIFFNDGAPDSSNSAGQRLLAHELTHTIQQGSARVARSTVSPLDTFVPADRIQRARPGDGVIQRGGDDDTVTDSSAGGGLIGGLLSGLSSMIWGAPAKTPDTPEPEKAKATPRITATAPVPLSAESTRTADDLRNKLGVLGSKNTLILQHGPEGGRELVDQRKVCATKLRAKTLTDQDVAKLTEAVAELERQYAQAEKAAADEKQRVQRDNEAEANAKAKAEAATAKTLQEQEALHQRAMDLAGKGGYPGLSKQFSDEKLLELLSLAQSNTLQTLLQSFNASDIELLLADETDKGKRLREIRANAVDPDDIGKLLKVNDLGPTELKTLLGFFTSTTLIAGAAFLPNGKALVKLAKTTPNEGEWLRFLSEIKITGKEAEVTAALASETAGVTEAQAETEKGYDASGLKADNGKTIKWVPYTNIVGDGEDNEQASVTAAIAALDKGTLAVRDDHENKEGNLPGRRRVNGVYDEYLVAKPEGAASVGARRLVVHRAKKFVYYTWTHYGQNGTPAFVRVK